MLKFKKRAYWLVVFILMITNLQGQPSNSIKLIALGDSYTIGESVSITERWPVQLIDSLRKRRISCYDPEIIATTGWRTDNLKHAIQNTNLINDYTLVTLLIGVNNYYQGGSLKTYSVEFEELLNISISLAGNDKNRVLVLSIPDYGYTPFGEGNQPVISKGIDSFNSTNKSITQKYGITYIDITEISRKGLKNPDLIASDGLHPSGKMYSQWAQKILKEFIK